MECLQFTDAQEWTNSEIDSSGSGNSSVNDPIISKDINLIKQESNKLKPAYLLKILFSPLIVIFKFSKNSVNRINFLFLLLINRVLFHFFDVMVNILNFTPNKINQKFMKLFFISGLIFMVVQSRKNFTHQTYETRRFFPRHSLVTDLYYGEISLLKQELLLSDLSFVLYYAPWDNDCQQIRTEFLKVASFHHEQVTFLSINCWIPGSECRSFYRMPHYPILVLHIRLPSSEAITVPYNGPLTSEYMIKFLSDSIRPIRHISNRTDIRNIALNNQIAVIGFYENTTSEEFLTFFRTSIVRLQFDNMKDTCFALVSNPVLAKTMGFSHSFDIHLSLWNDTKAYPRTAPYHYKNITQWLSRNGHDSVKWLNIGGSKSLKLNSIIDRGPFILLFTPFNPYHLSNDPFSLLWSAALDYINCNKSPMLEWVASQIGLNVRSQLRHSDQISRKYLTKHATFLSTLASSTYSVEEFDESYSLCLQENDINEVKDEIHQFPYISWNSFWSFLEIRPRLNKSRKTCLAEKDSTCSSSAFCGQKNASSRGGSLSKAKAKILKEPDESLPGPVIDETIDIMLDRDAEDHCKRIVLGALLAPPAIINEDKRVNLIKGLSCRTNRTLNFIAVNSLIHGELAQKIKLDLNSNDQENVGAVIIDPINEQLSYLNRPLSRHSLSDFIMNFTLGIITRSTMKSGENSKTECSMKNHCIKELTSDDYIPLTSTPGEYYVVLHYTRNCGACFALIPTILAVISRLNAVDNVIFAKIDISKHSLPWYLTFENVPNIIFFPAFSKSDSRIFDTSLNFLTVESLLQFISLGLTPAQRVSLHLQNCDIDCRNKYREKSDKIVIDLRHQYDSNSKKLVNLQALGSVSNNSRDRESRASLDEPISNGNSLFTFLELNTRQRLKNIEAKISFFLNLKDRIGEIEEKSDFQKVFYQ